MAGAALHWRPLWLALVVVPAMAQPVVRQRIIADGYEQGRLVRNHVVARYYHRTNALADGYVLLLKPACISNEPYTDSACVVADTLCRFRGALRNGRASGSFLFFPPDNVFYLENYHNGRRHGMRMGFYQNGSIHSSLEYADGRPVGTALHFYANGNLAEVKRKRAKVAAVVEYQGYYVNGSLFAEGIFYAERKVNEWRYYNPDGSRTKVEYYTPKGRLRAVRHHVPPQ